MVQLYVGGLLDFWILLLLLVMLDFCKWLYFYIYTTLINGNLNCQIYRLELLFKFIFLRKGVHTPHFGHKSIKFQIYRIVVELILVSHQSLTPSIFRPFFWKFCVETQTVSIAKNLSYSSKNSSFTKSTRSCKNCRKVVQKVVDTLFPGPQISRTPENRNFGWWTPFLRNINFGKKSLL